MTDKFAEAYTKHVAMMEENRILATGNIAQQPLSGPTGMHREQQMAQSDNAEHSLFSSAFAHVVKFPEPCEGYNRLNRNLDSMTHKYPPLKLVAGG